MRVAIYDAMHDDAALNRIQVFGKMREGCEVRSRETRGLSKTKQFHASRQNASDVPGAGGSHRRVLPILCDPRLALNFGSDGRRPCVKRLVDAAVSSVAVLDPRSLHHASCNAIGVKVSGEHLTKTSK